MHMHLIKIPHTQLWPLKRECPPSHLHFCVVLTRPAKKCSAQRKQSCLWTSRSAAQRSCMCLPVLVYRCRCQCQPVSKTSQGFAVGWTLCSLCFTTLLSTNQSTGSVSGYKRSMPWGDDNKMFRALWTGTSINSNGGLTKVFKHERRPKVLTSGKVSQLESSSKPSVKLSYTIPWVFWEDPSKRQAVLGTKPENVLLPLKTQQWLPQSMLKEN